MKPDNPTIRPKTAPPMVTTIKPVTVMNMLLVAVYFPRTLLGTYSCTHGKLAVTPIARTPEKSATITATKINVTSGPKA